MLRLHGTDSAPRARIRLVPRAWGLRVCAELRCSQGQPRTRVRVRPLVGRDRTERRRRGARGRSPRVATSQPRTARSPRIPNLNCPSDCYTGTDLSRWKGGMCPIEQFGRLHFCDKTHIRPTIVTTVQGCGVTAQSTRDIVGPPPPSFLELLRLPTRTLCPFEC